MERSNQEVMGVLLDIKDGMNIHGNDIRHLHFLVQKVVTGQPITEEELCMERITQFIPFSTYNKVQEIDLKLENNAVFYQSTV